MKDLFDRRWRLDCGLWALAVFTLCLFVPIFHVGATPAEFGFLDASVFSKATVGLAVLCFLPLLVLCTLMHGVGWKAGARWLAVLLLAWITLAGFASPLVRSSGMIEASETIVIPSRLILVAVLSLLFAFLSLTRLAFAPLAFCLVLLAASVAPALPAFVHAFEKEEAYPGFFDVSTEQNIFVVSFDGIPSGIAGKVLGGRPELAEAFKDFIFFSNAVSQAPATAASIRSELYGNRNYHVLGTEDHEVNAVLESEASLMSVVDNAYTYGSYNYYNANRSHRVPHLHYVKVTEQHKWNHQLYWMELLLARIGTPVLVGWADLGRLFEWVAGKTGLSRRWDRELAGRIHNYEGPRWKRVYLRQVDEFKWIVDHLVATKPGLAVRYYHFTFSHYPVDFDEHGTFRADDEKWHWVNQDEEGLYNQCIGELNQLSQWLDKLKELGIYDRSLVVFKSDHGKPANYYQSFPNDVQINDHELWGYDRYRPLLMIKDFGRSRDRMETEQTLVTLPDLAKTLCRAARVDGMDCSTYPGRDMLDLRQPPDHPMIYVECVKDADSSFRFNTHQTIILNRSGGDFYEALAASGLVDLYSDFQEKNTSALEEEPGHSP